MIIGQSTYPHQKQLLIEADSGNPNDSRSRVWKNGPRQLADEFSLIITMTHYPTGASKWNPIEHRMFNLIRANWTGDLLIATRQSSTSFVPQPRPQVSVAKPNWTPPNMN